MQSATFEIKTPAMGESVTEVTLAKWHKNEGEIVAKDEIIAELETDKVTLELTSPQSGIIKQILVASGENATIGQPLVVIQAQSIADMQPTVLSQDNSAQNQQQFAEKHSKITENPDAPSINNINTPHKNMHSTSGEAILSPSAAKLFNNNPEININIVEGSGKNGMIMRDDLLRFQGKNALDASIIQPSGEIASQIQEKNNSGTHYARAQEQQANSNSDKLAASTQQNSTNFHNCLDSDETKSETRQKMTKLRQTIAKKLKEAQNSAAILTTFNEVDMSQVIAWRQDNQEKFLAEFQVKLGFMSFFVKAAISALKEFPIIHAYIDGDDLVYRNYYDIGVAVATESGLIVPVIRSADKLTFGEIERKIFELGQKARENKLSLQEIRGGGFSITNGGIYGSMLSTPILNAPQSAILGMHNIVRRPVVIDDNDTIVVRPIMYLALSYDHRIIDGKQAVSFLKRIKELLENPALLLFKA